MNAAIWRTSLPKELKEGRRSRCARRHLASTPPPHRLTHNAALLFGNKYPKDGGEAWQRVKMKRSGGRGHGSAGSAEPPRCRLGFWCWELGPGSRFLMLCNFEDGAFEVMHELDSFPASSWFVFVFFPPPHHLFLLSEASYPYPSSSATLLLFLFFFSLFLPMRGASYMFEVKDCFKGICQSGLVVVGVFAAALDAFLIASLK